MINKIPWDIYEAAILLDGLLEYKKSNINKADIIRRISEQLRKKAINQGLIIDDIFRDQNGISLQLQRMNYAYEKITAEKTSTKLFNNIVNIYNTDRDRYNQILMKAKKMIINSNEIKEQFYDYVNNREPQKANEIFKAMKTIEDFAIKTNVIKHNLYEDLSGSTVDLLKKRVIRNKFFSVKNKKNILYAELGLTLLNAYITENNVNLYVIPQNKLSLKNDLLDTTTENTYDGNDKFIEWMINDQHLAVATAKSYRSALNTCNEYAHSHVLYTGSILDNSSYDDLYKLYLSLINDREFNKFNENRHNYLIAALKKYLEYTKSIPKSHLSISNDFSVPTTLSNNCNKVLKEYFEDGYCLGNYIHQMRFVSCYEELNHESIAQTGNELDSLLKAVGTYINGRVFESNNDNSNSILNDIYSDIQFAFENGASAIYIECIFEKYGKQLISEMKIYDAETLRIALQNDSALPMGYFVGKSDITMFGSTKDIKQEVKNALKSSHVPLTYDDLHSMLWYIPISKIKLALNQIPEAAHVDGLSYFYAPNINISSQELASLITAMHNAIYSKGYIVAKDLRELFRKSCPASAMDAENYKDYAIREILKVLLQDEFCFESCVITEIGKNLDIGSIYENYAYEHDKLTLAKLKEFENELGINIYWNNVMKAMIRISETEFINKQLIQFNSEAVDNILEELCPNDYIALKDIKLFLLFPEFSYKWNGFVLESYLRDYSEKFKLIQLSICSDNYIGVMLKKSSKIKTYDDIAADMLAHNTEWIDEKSALRSLVNAGFQQRASNKNISSIIKMAKQFREIKE